MAGKKIASVVGARPNFMKIAPFMRGLEKSPIEVDHRLIHTGQHYDSSMSHQFLEALRIGFPDVNLGIGSGSHADQVGRTMIEAEAFFADFMPDWVVVVGDVNAVCACSITAKKMGIRVALGARPDSLVKLILTRGMAISVLGIGSGLVVSYGLGRALEGLLFGVDAADFATLGAASIALFVTATLAAWLPARRASRVDAAVSLRE